MKYTYPSPLITGFVLNFHGPLYSAVEHDAIDVEELVTPITDFDSHKDDFAVAVFLKLMAVNEMSGPGLLLATHMSIYKDQVEMLLGSIDESIRILANVAKKKKEVTSVKGLGAEIVDAEQTGEPRWVKFGDMLFYITTVDFYPTNSIIGVYGPYPKEALSLKRRIGVAIPLNVVLVNRNLLAGKSSLPVFFPFNIPLVNFGSKSITSPEDVQVVARDATLTYPPAYIEVDNPDEVFAPMAIFTYHCPAIAFPEEFAEFGEIIIRRFSLPDRVKIRRPLYQRVVELCKQEGRKLMVTTSSVVGLHTWNLPVALPMVNATYWAYKHLKNVSDLVLKGVVKLTSNESFLPVKGVTHPYRLLAASQFFMYGFASIFSGTMKVRPFVEGTPDYKRVFFAIGFLPVDLYIGSKTKVEKGIEPILPTLITYSKHNVHPGGFYYGFPENGEFNLAFYKDRESFIRMLTYLYFRRIDLNTDSYEHPTDIEEVEIKRSASWNGDDEKVIPHYEGLFYSIYATVDEMLKEDEKLAKLAELLGSEIHMGGIGGWIGYFAHQNNDLVIGGKSVDIYTINVAKRILNF